jgi:hypothetical protein
MFRASLEQKNVVVLEDDLALQLPEAHGANGYGNVIKQIRPYAFAHSAILHA